MQKHRWLDLQLFAGEGDGGEGATTGESAVDPGQQRLLELGVPADKIRKRAQKSVPKLPEGAVRSAPQQEQSQTTVQAAAAENPTEAEQPTETPVRPSFEELMKDPEYNRQMQAVVQSRLRTAKTAEENLGKLAPALELLARKHGQDPAKLDYEALAKAISDDSAYYEDKALEMGVSLETAKRLDQQERETARQQRQQAITLEQQKFQQHIQSMEQQGEALKKVFPDFDLRKELQNPAFARMTAPNVGISVEDAYYAVHRNEIQTRAMQVTAQKTAQKLSNAIQSNSRRPQENGAGGQIPSVTSFDYRAASPEQRRALKDHIRAEAAKGRKVYPGSYTGR